MRLESFDPRVALTAFDGDRVMGVFIGDKKNTAAAKCALKINHAVVNIINPAIVTEYPSTPYVVKHAIGIDTSPLFIARTGVRGANDLVWVGRAANYAAKLCSFRKERLSSWITKDVYDNLSDSVKLGPKGEPMWEAYTWNSRSMAVYASGWMWAP